jgi:hypothetical protein
MADRFRLRIVRPPEASGAEKSRRRRPGVGVVLIAVYASLFAAGLVWFRSASPLFRGRGRTDEPRGGGPGGRPAASASTSTSASASVSPAATAPTPPPPPRTESAADRLARRAALLAGEGLSPVARREYERRISAQACPCGCELTVQACLARDRACSRSPEAAEKIRAEVAAKTGATRP